MTAGADLRLLRAAVFTAVCVTLSAAGHTLASGGQGVAPGSVVIACAGVFAVAVPLAGRERSLPGIAALLAVGQIVLHAVFSCGQQAAAHRGPGGAGIREFAGRLLCNGPPATQLTDAEARRIVADAGLSVHQAQQAAGGTPSPGHGGELSALECLRDAADAFLSLLDTPMLLGHAGAALVLGWLLRRGEAALWRLVRLSARSAAATVSAGAAPLRALRRAVAYVRALSAGLLPHAPARAFAAGRHGDEAPSAVLLHHSVHRRGPPLTEHRTSTAPLVLAA